jgi:hypothetical protein
MPETYRFFDQVSYSEADQAEVQARMVRDGVLVGYAGELAVSAAGGFATVSTGEAFVQGFWYRNDAPKALPIAANTSSTPRVDMVVLHLDRVVNTLVATIHEGVLGAGAPALTQVVGGTWELPLASISTTSAGSVVTDARQWQTNVYNPMTTADDIIIAGVSGVPRRRAKGPNSSVFGVDAAGSLGYQTNTGSALAVLTDWKENTDIYSGSTWSAGVAQPFGTTKTFVVQNSGSLIEISVSVAIFNTNTPAPAAETQSFMLVDGVRYELGSAGSNAYGNPFAGSKPVYISGLAPGNHTVQVYAWSSSTTSGWYCRCNSFPTFEHYYLQVIEHKIGVGVQGPVGPAGSGMANPMTTLGDMIVAGAAGVPGRLAKGINNTSLHIDSAGTMNWQSSIRHAGQWTQNTNVHNGTVTSSAGQELDAQTAVMPFTITSPNSALLFYSQGTAQINYQFGGENATIVNTYLRGDGTYIWLWMTSTFQPTAANVNYFVSLSSVAIFDAAQLGGVGSHFAQVRMVLSSGNMVVYLRPQSSAYEQFQMGCLEFIP